MRKICLLSISFDDALFKRNSSVLKRQKLYATFFKEYLVIALTTKKKVKPILIGNLSIYPTNSKNKFFYFTDAIKHIYNLTKKYSIDLVTTQDPFTTGLIGVFSKIFFGVKLNIQVHNDFFNNRLFRSESRQNFLQYILGRFNLVFADSVRVVAKRLNYKDHSFTAPVPVPLDYFWGRPKAKKGFRIVSVGRLVKQKNYPLLIGAAKFLIKIFPTMKIKIVGDGPERQHLKKIISELGLKKVVKLVGSKTPGEIRKLFFDSNLYVQTSDYEGWGMGIIEAAASGLPIVMTDTGCAGEIIKDQETFGLVIPQNDSLELVTAISTVFTNTPFFKKIILKGQNVLKKRYTLDQLITQMVSGYEKTVTKK